MIQVGIHRRDWFLTDKESGLIGLLLWGSLLIGRREGSIRDLLTEMAPREIGRGLKWDSCGGSSTRVPMGLF